MKLSKSDIQHIKKIAMALPKCYTAENQRTVKYMTGAALIAMGKTKDLKGRKLDPNTTYEWVMSGGVEVNHFKRLKKLCESGQVKNAQNYINEVIGMGSSHIDLLSGLSKRAQIL